MCLCERKSVLKVLDLKNPKQAGINFRSVKSLGTLLASSLKMYPSVDYLDEEKINILCRRLA